MNPLDSPHEQAQPAARPLFSVVTVTFNAGAELQRTVDSLAAQTCQDFEHVIQDGGSTDGSVEALRTAYRPQVTVEKDDGIYDAMNRAIPRCRGRFIQFLNAGDTLAGPEVLAAVARSIDHHPNTELFYCDNVNAASGLRSRVPPRLSPFYLYRRPVCHQAWFIAAQAFQWIGAFDTRYRLTADHDFFVRAVVRNGMVARRVPVLGIAYQGGGASEQPQNRREILADYERIRSRYYTRAERLLYGWAFRLTVPRLRTWLHDGCLGPLYVSLVNAIRRRPS